MKFFNKILQFKIYRKIIISYGMMLILTVVFLSYMLFYLFSSRAAKEIDNTSKEMLMQTSYASEVVYNQVTNISSQLLNDDSIISFLYSKGSDKVANYNISTQLTKIQNIYPFIKSIGIFNLQNGLNIDTAGIPLEDEYLYENKKKYIEFFPRKVSMKVYDSDLYFDLMTFIIFPDFSLLKSSGSAIVINIDENGILNTISNISGISPETTTFVIDSKGVVLSHTDSSFFMKDISTEGYIKKILDENRDQGSFIQNIDNKKQLVTYVKADKMNWYFISIKVYNQLLGDIYQLRNVTLLIALLLIISGIIISISLAGAIYNPIKSLIEKVGSFNSTNYNLLPKFDEYEFLSKAFSESQEDATFMKSSMYRSSLIAEESYILNLLKVNLSKVNISQEVSENIRNKLSGPYFCIFLIKIDNYQNFKEGITIKDQSLFHFAICNIAQELFSNLFCCETAIPKEEEVVVLAQLTRDRLPEEIYLTLHEIQDAIRNYFNFSISICISDIINSIDDIAISYKTVQEYSKYRLFYGYECILDPVKVNTYASKTILYPFTLEKKIIEALQVCNSKLIQIHIDEFIKSISTVNYFQAINYSNQIMLSVLKSFDSIFNMKDENAKNYFDAINQINHSETIHGISQIMTELCKKMCIKLEEKNNNLNTLKHKRIVDDVKEYIQKNYNNPNLSIELVSDIVKLSPGYLGKLFKSFTAVSFNDYINDVRLKKAKELLITTCEPASRICERVGIFNITYFSTLFKKTYGMTPSQFRCQITDNTKT